MNQQKHNKPIKIEVSACVCYTSSQLMMAVAVIVVAVQIWCPRRWAVPGGTSSETFTDVEAELPRFVVQLAPPVVQRT